jgi:hypothetical protein
LLNCMVSFDVYSYDSKFFKRNIGITIPTAYVVVTYE